MNDDIVDDDFFDDDDDCFEDDEPYMCKGLRGMLEEARQEVYNEEFKKALKIVSRIAHGCCDEDIRKEFGVSQDIITQAHLALTIDSSNNFVKSS